MSNGFFSGNVGFSVFSSLRSYFFRICFAASVLLFVFSAADASPCWADRYSDYEKCIKANQTPMKNGQLLSAWCLGCNRAWSKAKYNECVQQSKTFWIKNCSQKHKKHKKKEKKKKKSKYDCSNSYFNDSRIKSCSTDCGKRCGGSITYNACMYWCKGNLYCKCGKKSQKAKRPPAHMPPPAAKKPADTNPVPDIDGDDTGDNGCPEGYVPEGNICVPESDDGRGIELAHARFLVNFDGKMQVRIDGRIIDPKKSDLSGVKVELLETDDLGIAGRGHGIVKNPIVISGRDGKFSFVYRVPEIEERGKLDERYLSLQLKSAFGNPVVRLYQAETAPIVVGLKRRTNRQIGAGSWVTFSFDVLDPDNDTIAYIVMSRYGMARVARNEHAIEGGSAENLGRRYRVLGSYHRKPVEFAWLAPKLGLQFVSNWWRSIKAATIGIKPEERAMWHADNIKTFVDYTKERMSHDFMSWARSKALSDALENAPKEFAMPRALLGAETRKLAGGRYLYLTKGVKRVSLDDYFHLLDDERQFKAAGSLAAQGVSSIMTACKLVKTFPGSYKTIEDHFARMQLDSNMSWGEWNARLLRSGIEAFGIVESAFGIAGKGVDWMGGVPGGFVAGQVINVGKGALDFVIDTFEEGRSQERVFKIPIFVQAVDARGHRSPWVRVEVDVHYYSSEPKEVQ